MESSENKKVAKSLPPWFVQMLVGIVVGLVVSYFAQGVIKFENQRRDRLEQERHELCHRAVRILQQRFASIPWKGPGIPIDYRPQHTNPSQVDVNETATMLDFYFDQELGNEFRQLFAGTKTAIDIGDFVGSLRRRAIVDSGSWSSDDFLMVFFEG